MMIFWFICGHLRARSLLNYSNSLVPAPTQCGYRQLGSMWLLVAVTSFLKNQSKSISTFPNSSVRSPHHHQPVWWWTRLIFFVLVTIQGRHKALNLSEFTTFVKLTMANITNQAHSNQFRSPRGGTERHNGWRWGETSQQAVSLCNDNHAQYQLPSSQRSHCTALPGFQL